MRKLKLYLDTSVISHLDAPDTPEKMAETLAFWNILKTGKYDVVISDVVTEEIERCREPKRTLMDEKIAEISPIILAPNQEVKGLAMEYINRKVLSQKSIDDCLHIAMSVIHRCDYLVSWNFKHLVNVQTMEGVKIVNAINHYQEIKIVAPNMFLRKEDL
jgi:predicted nucleic acid-binding protein